MADLFRGRRYYLTSLLISGSALVLLILHSEVWAQVDLTSVALLLILLSPWLFPFVTKVSFPGGGGIEIRAVEDLEKQVEKIKPPITVRTKAAPKQVSIAARVIDEDPNLALASIRMGLEQSLRKLSGRYGDAANQYSLGQLVKFLTTKEVLPMNLVRPIQSIVSICNRALHQADVDQETAQRVIMASGPVFEALEDISEETQS